MRGDDIDAEAHLLDQLRQERDDERRSVGAVPVGQQHHGDGTLGHEVRLRPVLWLHLVHADRREQPDKYLGRLLEVRGIGTGNLGPGSSTGSDPRSADGARDAALHREATGLGGLRCAGDHASHLLDLLRDASHRPGRGVRGQAADLRRHRRGPTPLRARQARLGAVPALPETLFLGDSWGWPGLGFSFTTRSPVRSIIASRAFVTVQLSLGAALVRLSVGIPIGVLSALRPRSLRDRLAMAFALFGVSAPVFWLGLMCLWLFWFKLHWAAGSGYVSIGTSLSQWFSHMLMPWIVLALLFTAFYARMARGTLIETMGEDYIRTARAKGLPEWKVVVKHGLRSSLTPIVTMLGLDLGTLLGGAIITETVFNLQGLGLYSIQSVYRGDLPGVLAVTVLASLAIALMNLIVDVVYAFLDPRVRFA